MYSNALRLDEANADIHFKLGWSCYRDGKTTDGLDKMMEAIESGGESSENFTKLGEILMRDIPE